MKYDFQVHLNEVTIIQAENIIAAVAQAKRMAGAKNAEDGDVMRVEMVGGSEYERVRFVRQNGRWMRD